MYSLLYCLLNIYHASGSVLSALQTLSHFTGPSEVGIVTPTLQKQKLRHTEPNYITLKHTPLTYRQQCRQVNRFFSLQNLKHVLKSLPGVKILGMVPKPSPSLKTLSYENDQLYVVLLLSARCKVTAGSRAPTLLTLW